MQSKACVPRTKRKNRTEIYLMSLGEILRKVMDSYPL